MKFSILAAMLALVVTATAAADSRPKLAPGTAKQLRSMPLLIIYTDPSAPVDYYMSWRPPMPPLPDTVALTPADSDSGTAAYGGNSISPMGGAAGMAGQALVKGLFGPGDIMGNASKRLQPFIRALSNLPLSNEEYLAAKDVADSVHWLNQAPSQHVALGNESDIIRSFMRVTSPRAVIVLTPSVRLRDDMNELVVVYKLNIYARDFYAPKGSSNLLAHAIVGGVRAADKTHGFPIVNYYDGDQAAILDASVSSYFNDGGTRFHQEFDETLAEAKAQLAYYFTGSDAHAGNDQGAATGH